MRSRFGRLRNLGRLVFNRLLSLFLLFLTPTRPHLFYSLSDLSHPFLPLLAVVDGFLLVYLLRNRSFAGFDDTT
jgi:hypothetical protein